MPDARSRPFDLFAALILMAALAVGVGLALMERRLERNSSLAIFNCGTSILSMMREDSRDIEPDAYEPEAYGPAAAEAASDLDPTEDLPSLSPSPVAGWGRLDDLIGWWCNGHGEACILGPFTLAAGALCLRRPRPRLRSLVLRVRFVPTLCFATCLAIATPLMLLKDLTTGSRLSYFSLDRFIDAIQASGAGVLAIGIGLALGRRFRVRGRPDWLGLVIGIYWAWLWAWSFMGRL